MFCFIPRCAAVLLLVVAGALAPAAAQERPLNASGEGFVDSVGSLFGRGEATHLGRSSLSVSSYDRDLLSSGYFFAFGGYLRSASGDFLDFAFDEVYYLFDPATGIVSATVTFTGGTGRFQDVTGSADVTFDLDSNLHNFGFLIDGSIDY